MENIPNTQIYAIMKRYWQRRRYQRLGSNGKDIRVKRLGGKGNLSGKFKVIQKLKLGFKSVLPIQLLAKLRGACNNMMFGISGNAVSLNGEHFLLQTRTSMACSFGKFPDREEFENRFMFEICNALVGSYELARL